MTLAAGANGGGLTGTINNCKITQYEVKSTQDGFVTSNMTLAITSQDADVYYHNSHRSVYFNFVNDATFSIYNGGTAAGVNSLDFYQGGANIVKMRLNSTGNLLIGTTTDNNTDTLQANGSIIGTVLKSSIATGTAPLTVASTTVVTNLNSSLLGGYTANQLSFYLADGTIGSNRTVSQAGTLIFQQLADNGFTLKNINSGYTTKLNLLTSTGRSLIIENSSTGTNFYDGGVGAGITMVGAKVGIAGSVNSSYDFTVNGTQSVTGNLTANTATIVAAPAVTATTSTQLYSVGTGGAIEKVNAYDLLLAGSGGINGAGNVVSDGTTFTINSSGYLIYNYYFNMTVAQSGSTLSSTLTATNVKAGQTISVRINVSSPITHNFIFDTMFKSANGSNLGTLTLTSTSKKVYIFRAEGTNLYLQD